MPRLFNHYTIYALHLKNQKALCPEILYTRMEWKRKLRILMVLVLKLTGAQHMRVMQSDILPLWTTSNPAYHDNPEFSRESVSSTIKFIF